jgi:hypothetical protein
LDEPLGAPSAKEKIAESVLFWWSGVFWRQLVRQLWPHAQDQLAHGRADVFHALEFEALLVNLLLSQGLAMISRSSRSPCPMPIMPRPPDISPAIIA